MLGKLLLSQNYHSIPFPGVQIHYPCNTFFKTSNSILNFGHIFLNMCVQIHLRWFLVFLRSFESAKRQSYFKEMPSIKNIDLSINGKYDKKISLWKRWWIFFFLPYGIYVAVRGSLRGAYGVCSTSRLQVLPRKISPIYCRVSYVAVTRIPSFRLVSVA